MEVNLYSFTLAPVTMVPIKPLSDEQGSTIGDAVCVELLQLLTITTLLARHWVSPFPLAFAKIILLSNSPDTATDQVPP